MDSSPPVPDSPTRTGDGSPDSPSSDCSSVGSANADLGDEPSSANSGNESGSENANSGNESGTDPSEAAPDTPAKPREALKKARVTKAKPPSTLTSDTLMRMASQADLEDDNELPPGPSSLKGLFEWPERNARILAAVPEFIDAFKALSAHDILLFDSYSGTGNGSSSFKLQYNALAAATGVHIRHTSVRTCTACDRDTTCQQFIKSLNQAYQPEHVLTDLTLHVTSECREELFRARAAIQGQIEWQMRLHEIVPLSREELELKANMGQTLMKDYMDILSENGVLETHARCVRCNQDCLTPYGHAVALESATSPGPIRIHVGGSTCTDVSSMGLRASLLGDSSLPLAIFLTEIKRCAPEVVVHECTSYFGQHIFGEYLEDYTVHRFEAPDGANPDQLSTLSAGFSSGTWLLSPHQFSWPVFRPRLYTVLVHKEKARLDPGALKAIQLLYAKPSLSADSLFCAPEDAIQAERARQAHRLKRSLNSKFVDLLGGAKPLWVQKYRAATKVRKHFKSGARCVIANITQNPSSRPIVAKHLPTLLKASLMWKLYAPAVHDQEERYLLGQEHLVSMGVPVYDWLSSSSAHQPFCRWLPSDTQQRKLAGNAMHSAVVGSVHGILMVSLKLRGPC